MGMSVAHYLTQLQALLPSGAAWPREQDATLTKLLTGLAEELARVDARAGDLVDESDPRGTFELLYDWERAFDLPDRCACLSAGDQTVEQRRNALVAKVTGIGGQSRQYFIDLAASLGYQITITEFRPYTVGDTVDQPIYGTEWWFAWQIDAPESTVIPFTSSSDVATPLATWGNAQLECVMRRLKPAHTHVLFSYGG